jgi:hypothetical protein
MRTHQGATRTVTTHNRGREYTMKLAQVGSNQTVITLHNGTKVFFSYETPVAAYVPEQGWLKTERFYSRTTSKHINRWLPEREGAVVPQATLDALLGAV